MPSLDDLIAAARARTAHRERIASLDLADPAAFDAYVIHVFGVQLTTTPAWVVTRIPNRWYAHTWSLQLTLADGGAVLLSYAWHGPDIPSWTVDRPPDPQPGHDVGLFHAACPEVMVDRLVLAIATLRTTNGSTPPAAGWSEDDIHPNL